MSILKTDTVYYNIRKKIRLKTINKYVQVLICKKRLRELSHNRFLLHLNIQKSYRANTSSISSITPTSLERFAGTRAKFPPLSIKKKLGKPRTEYSSATGAL
ncbi:MAG: hypothetical protein HC803_06730 [Saprospiraceae bacterium]|nr:hypothetical protein [Saprospiraceae bacterium]